MRRDGGIFWCCSNFRVRGGRRRRCGRPRADAGEGKSPIRPRPFGRRLTTVGRMISFRAIGLIICLSDSAGGRDPLVAYAGMSRVNAGPYGAAQDARMDAIGGRLILTETSHFEVRRLAAASSVRWTSRWPGRHWRCWRRCFFSSPRCCTLVSGARSSWLSRVSGSPGGVSRPTHFRPRRPMLHPSSRRASSACCATQASTACQS